MFAISSVFRFRISKYRHVLTNLVKPTSFYIPKTTRKKCVRWGFFLDRGSGSMYDTGFSSDAFPNNSFDQNNSSNRSVRPDQSDQPNPKLKQDLKYQTEKCNCPEHECQLDNQIPHFEIIPLRKCCGFPNANCYDQCFVFQSY